jgi:hypothetical protein
MIDLGEAHVVCYIYKVSVSISVSVYEREKN